MQEATRNYDLSRKLLGALLFALVMAGYPMVKHHVFGGEGYTLWSVIVPACVGGVVYFLLMSWFARREEQKQQGNDVEQSAK